MNRWGFRALCLAILLVVTGVLAYGAVTAPQTSSADTVPEPAPRDNVTVVSESAKYGTLIAWNPNGSLLYYSDNHTKYFDVDPVGNESLTVEYAATDTIHRSGPECTTPPCTRNVIERVNLTTGETREVYARYDYRERAGEWHDHVRVDENHILIADIVADQVFLVNTDTEVIEWLWDAQSDFPVSGGGPYPDDWAHINDVELLDDGRIMVSLRNQDQVVFIDPETGLDPTWTLGSDDAHRTLYEQHNPDYLPPEAGGPAVLVSDSENGRLVEYQRDGSGWNRTWSWTDDRLQWPRDVDRLPNGHTLVADTHGKRIFELAPNGSIVWSVPVTHPYDVERLGTGPGSTGGQTATHLNLTSQTGHQTTRTGFDPFASITAGVKAVFPPWFVNGIIYLSPVWMGRPQFFAVACGFLTAILWSAVELRWYGLPIRIRSPIYRSDQ